jgi:hypothetical protein
MISSLPRSHSRTVQILRPEAIRQELAQRPLQHVLALVVLVGGCRGLSGVSRGHEIDGHAESAELSDELATDAAGGDRGGDITVGRRQVGSAHVL